MLHGHISLQRGSNSLTESPAKELLEFLKILLMLHLIGAQSQSEKATLCSSVLCISGLGQFLINDINNVTWCRILTFMTLPVKINRNVGDAALELQEQYGYRRT